MTHHLQTQDRIIFFDGVCNLCNAAIDLVLKFDQKGVFKIASLQGQTAESLLKNSPLRTELKAIVYWDQGRVSSGGEAVLKILHELNGLRWLGKLGRLLPSRLLIYAYNWVADHRYQVFGQRDTCRLPTPEERRRFLP